MQIGCIILKKPIPRSYSSDRMVIAYTHEYSHCGYPLSSSVPCNQPGDEIPDTLVYVGVLEPGYPQPQHIGESGASPDDDNSGLIGSIITWLSEDDEDDDSTSGGSSGGSTPPACITDPNIMCE